MGNVVGPPIYEISGQSHNSLSIYIFGKGSENESISAFLFGLLDTDPLYPKGENPFPDYDRFISDSYDFIPRQIKFSAASHSVLSNKEYYIYGLNQYAAGDELNKYGASGPVIRQRTYPATPSWVGFSSAQVVGWNPDGQAYFVQLFLPSTDIIEYIRTSSPNFLGFEVMSGTDTSQFIHTVEKIEYSGDTYMFNLKLKEPIIRGNKVRVTFDPLVGYLRTVGGKYLGASGFTPTIISLEA